MNSLEICRRDSEIGTLIYSLTIDLSGSPIEGYGTESYGVGVRNDKTGDCAAVRNITPLYSRIEQILKRIADGLVTPASLFDVVSDIISE